MTDGIDLNAPVQEVIDRGSWAAGNNMVLLLQGKSDIASFGYFNSFSHFSQEPQITFTYTVGGGGPSTVASRRLLSGMGR